MTPLKTRQRHPRTPGEFYGLRARVWLTTVMFLPQPEATEWFCLRAGLWWLLLLQPSLSLFATNPNFAPLAAHGGEGRFQLMIGGTLVCIAAAVLSGLPWARFAALWAAGFVWGFVAGLIGAGSPALWGPLPKSTGFGVYGLLALDCFAVGIHVAYRWYCEVLARQGPYSLPQGGAALERAEKTPERAEKTGADTENVG